MDYTKATVSATLPDNGPAGLADWAARQAAVRTVNERLANASGGDRLRGITVACLGPDGETMFETAALGPYPAVHTGSTTLDTIESFTEHVRRCTLTGSVCFVTVCDDGVKAVAVFDYHTTERPGWCQWTSKLELCPDPSFSAWRKVLDKPLAAADLAELIEENEADFLEPTAAHLLEVALTLRATHSARVHEAHRLDNGDVSFEYTTTTDVAAGRNEALRVPSEVRLRLPVMTGQAPVELRCLFRYALKEGRLAFRIVLPGLQRLLQAEGERLAGELSRGLGIPVYRGRIES